MVNERNETVKNVTNFVAGIVLALVCGGFAGCTDVDFHWSENRSNAKVVGFVDDSLVMVGDYRYWEEITDEWNGGYSDIEGFGHERLCVYNYRVQEDGPRWCDSLSSESATGMFGMKDQGSSTSAGQMTDSVIWAIRSSNTISLWKIGEKVHELKLSKLFDGCSGEFVVASVKQWFDDKFIVRGDKSLISDGCQYAVLDTVARTVTYKRLDENLKWLQKCDDVRAWGEDVYCIVLKENEESLVVKNKEEFIDAPFPFRIGGFWGNVMKLGSRLCLINHDSIECSDVSWFGGLEFKSEDGRILSY
ncbi:hypothetical protein SAMN05720764_1379 [Fibrobacter sp. UWH5]|nr:hypothetical protein SAMN05720764_1379 [Fibrobacter sp. UWH5]